MFGSGILEVAIGIIFVYLLVSVICSAVREALESVLKTRAAYLEHGMRELLHDPEGVGIALHVYNHPLVAGLYAGPYVPRTTVGRPPVFAVGKNLPTYIPTRNFALALLDIAVRGPITDVVSSDPTSPAITLDNVRANVMNVGNGAVQRVVLMALDTAEGDLERAQKALEDWYDSGMDRVSGWYKRSTHWIIFGIGIAVAVGFNVNTLRIADFLYRNDTARRAIVARAEAAVQSGSADNVTGPAAWSTLDSLRLPIGWQGKLDSVDSRGRTRAPTAADTLALVPEKSLWTNGVAPVLGWLLTALAATMGAPFWFDMLNKVTVVRSTVKPHEKSPEESSEDRQTGDDRRPTLDVRGGGARGGGGGGGDGAYVPRAITAVPTPRDADSAVDGCEVLATAGAATPDEELPMATGGVE